MLTPLITGLWAEGAIKGSCPIIIWLASACKSLSPVQLSKILTNRKKYHDTLLYSSVHTQSKTSQYKLIKFLMTSSMITENCLK